VLARTAARAASVDGVARCGTGPWPAVDVQLQPAALVEGRVIDAATRAPVAGAHVALVPDSGPARIAETGADGAFRLEGVIPGAWAIDVVATGFLPPDRDGVEVAAEQTLSLEIPLARGGAIAGRVVDGRGAPVAGARVEAFGEARGGHALREGVTGRARRWARALGAAPPDRAGDATTSRPGFLAIGELGVTVGPVPFAPPKGVRVATRPTAADDATAPAADDPPLSGEALAAAEKGLVTDADGRFAIDALPAGAYRVRAFHPDFAGGESDRLDVPAGGDPRQTTVVVTRGASLAGRVLDASGAAVPGATLVAWRGDVRVGETMADDGGRYRLDRLTGRVRVVASAPGAADGALEVELGAADEGHELGRDVRLGAFGAPTGGVVEDPSGRALAAATIVALVGGEARASTASDADGRFTLVGLPAGAIWLRVESDGYPPLAMPARAGDANLRVRVKPGGGVDGIVRDAHTRGRIAEFQVHAVGPDGAERTQSHRAGEFELSPLQPGRWTLTFTAKGHARQVVTVDVPAGRGARAVSVPDLRVDLEQGATLGGTIYDAHGEIVAGASVSGGGARATSGKDGRYKLVDVAAGDVTIEVRAGEAGAGRKLVRVRPGDELYTIDVKLGP
jgi:hypothetical protein